MMSMRTLFLFPALLAGSTLAFAQAPAAPASIYSGSFGGGLAVTSGNTDTDNFNLTFSLVRDPKTRNVMKANASYLRGNQNKVLNLDRTSVLLRDEYRVSGKAFVYGQVDYLRDRFKQIIFFWAPGGGVGYRFADSDATKFGVDGGLGLILERNPGRKTSKSGSVTVGQNFRRKISGSATFTQSVSTIWKMNDFDDSLTNFSVGLTTSVLGKLELKLEFLDSYKNKPASAAVKKNDTAFVTAFVVKF
jgi:putative salt-induced outer membrane protein YdiY